MESNGKNKSRPKTSMRISSNQQKILTVGLDFGKHTDLYAGVYNGNDINQTNMLPSFKSAQIKKQNNKRVSGIYKNMNIKAKISKTIEEVQQQNNQLKNQNNKLRHQMLIIKGKLSKKLANAPENFYSNTERTLYGDADDKTCRILGMRQQYQNLKTQFQQQKKQLEQTKRKLFCSGLPQIQVYLKEIQEQNKRLKKIMQKNLRNTANIENKQIKKLRSASKSNLASTPNKQLISQNTPNQLKILQQKIKKMQLKLIQKDNKIEYLQKSFIKKDNREHSANKKMHKIQKQRQQTISEYNSLRTEAVTEIKKYNIEIVRLKGKHKWELQSLKKQYEKQIMVKDKQIEEMIQANKKFREETNKSRAGSQAYYKTDLGLRNGSRKASIDFMNTNLLNSKNPKSEYIKVHTQKNEIIYFANIDGLQIQPNRQPKSANINNFPDGQKLKIVQLNEIKQIGELLYYRMIANKIKPIQIKQYFQYKAPKQQNSEKLDIKSEKQSDIYSSIKNYNLQFQKQYIKMKQTQQILMAHPFNLNKQQSFLLARYLIQDSDQGYVYCHQCNENKRQIVKSILKAVIGQWQLKSSQQIQQMQFILKQNEDNIKRMIQTYFTDGFLTRNQLSTIMKASDLGSNKTFIQYLIMKMSQFSISLQKLDSKQFFQTMPI